MTSVRGHQAHALFRECHGAAALGGARRGGRGGWAASRILEDPLHVVLLLAWRRAYDLLMKDVTLPRELERFAAEAIAAGRYRDMTELLAAGVGLLQRAEAARAEFIASLEAAEAESERDGWYTIDEVHAEMTALIDEARRAKV